MTNQKVEAARKRYEALLQAAQQEFDALKERRSGLTERMSAVKGRLEDIQLALDAFAVAPEPQEEESAPEPPSAPEPTPSPVSEEAAPTVRPVRRGDLKGLDVIDALLLLARQHRRREVDAMTAAAWLKRAGYRNRQNKVPTQNAVSNALVREHNLEASSVARVARGVYRLNW